MRQQGRGLPAFLLHDGTGLFGDLARVEVTARLPVRIDAIDRSTRNEAKVGVGDLALENPRQLPKVVQGISGQVLIAGAGLQRWPCPDSAERKAKDALSLVDVAADRVTAGSRLPAERPDRHGWITIIQWPRRMSEG
jgi:hypothetical protein